MRGSLTSTRLEQPEKASLAHINWHPSNTDRSIACKDEQPLNKLSIELIYNGCNEDKSIERNAGQSENMASIWLG